MWRRFADYHVLYEFAYDGGDAASLIVRIPVDETSTNESMTITGDVGRWDDKNAPVFSVRGPAKFAGLAALAFLPNGIVLQPTGEVTIVRTFDGAPGPPSAASFAEFVDAITATPPSRNLSFSFAKIGVLLAQFTAEPTAVDLGDWDGDGVVDSYASSRLTFPEPLVLPSVADRLELSYATSHFDQKAVVYLRATRQGD